jgi:exopolyphosphatase/guanosine-5'-triphosphate,3'-diphosphate pyrophosphatase
MTRRVAAIDCGTNSIRLLIADLPGQAGDVPGQAGDRGSPSGGLGEVARRMEIIRLGQGVDATGRLAPEALDRMETVLRDYAAEITASGVVAVRMVATSATRDAQNAADFVHRVRDVLGTGPEVLSGDAEARLSFTGATAELDPAQTGPCLVADIGGGSTELVLGTPGRPSTDAISVNIGCVRMTERHLRGDPPTAAQIAGATADIDAALEQAAMAVPADRARTLVGLAGSVTTVAAIAMGLTEYDPACIHHSRISAADVHAVTTVLLAQTRDVRAKIGVMHPGRVDVIGGGALVLDRIMRRFGFAEVLVSEHDILDGIAWSMASAPPTQDPTRTLP